MARDDAQFRLRLPADLKERIDAEADASGRSLNSEITRALIAFYQMPEPAEEESMADLMREQIRLLKKIAGEA